MQNKYFYIFIFVIFLAGCKSIEPVIGDISSKDDDIGAKVNSLVKKLNDDQKRGAFMMISIPDIVLSDETIDFLLKYNITGVILFRHNIVSEKQVKKLTSDLRCKVDKSIIIGVDQEGGDILRIHWDPNADITARMIGKSGDLDYAYRIASMRASFLLSLGINLIFGPVADIAASKKSYIYERCFSTDVNTVSQMVYHTVKAQRKAGIISVLKHFPGHGDTVIDSHFDFPRIDHESQLLLKREIRPFIAGINAGAEMLMIGHIVNSYFDEQTPASVSKRYFNLINQTGFDGIIITDDLSMTGKLDGVINWGINLVSGTLGDIEKMITKIKPNEYYLKRIIKFKLETLKES